MRSQRVVDLPAHRLPAAPPRLPLYERILLILWPAFVMAGVLEMLVFAVVDPTTMRWFGGEPIDWSRSAVYSVTFFIFWGVIATSGAITALLETPPDE
ncbi:MAG TPA: hypothetical protein VFZ93_09600 [Albitalea sp.]